MKRTTRMVFVLLVLAALSVFLLASCSGSGKENYPFDRLKDGWTVPAMSEESVESIEIRVGSESYVLSSAQIEQFVRIYHRSVFVFRDGGTTPEFWARIVFKDGSTMNLGDDCSEERLYLDFRTSDEEVMRKYTEDRLPMKLNNRELVSYIKGFGG
ncbi:MAG: hypothetical protein J6112_09285 [Clostridia bacterium]|nr:hypothetical protein [Clostridia bacterium]